MFGVEKVSIFMFIIIRYQRKFINNENFLIFGYIIVVA